MAWASNGTPVTLGAPADVMNIADLTALKFNFYLSHALNSGNIGSTLTFDGVTGTSYGQQSSANGALDVGVVNAPDLKLREQLLDQFEVGYFMNFAGQNKLVYNMDCSNSVTGPGTVPNRRKLAGKFIQTTQATQITNTNDQAGSFATGSSFQAFGTD